jgi:glycosyltransferase involved in cell wall biosynthesis
MPAKIFILIPAYNLGLYIDDAIKSIQAQTYSDWELLVLDDCSTDSTIEVVKKYVSTDSRIRYIRNEQNLGMLKNWNKGISYCRSKYFLKLDGDDIVHQDMLQSSLNILEIDANDSIGIVFTRYSNIDQDGNIIKDSEIVLPEFARDKTFSCTSLVSEGASKMLSYEVLRQGLALIRTKVFAELGAYRVLLSERTQAATDTEFYFRVGCHYKIYCINKVLYYYRVHPRSISSADHAKGLSPLKLFEVKTAINDYYYKQNKITKSFWRKNAMDIKFTYFVFLNYQSRLNRNVGNAILYSFKLLLLNPITTLKFYWSRIFN